MATTGIVEPVDVLEDGGFGLTPRWPALPPNQLRLDCFEERLDRRVIVTIALATH